MDEVVEAVADPQQPHHHEQLAVQQLRVLCYTESVKNFAA